MTIDVVISLIGLVLDIIGAFLLAIYGIWSTALNENFEVDLKKLMVDNPELKNHYLRTKRRFRFGMSLLVFGFLLQFIGTAKVVSKYYPNTQNCSH
ncbi:MAG: hypothetical protein PSX36_00375 [bacterium]|nr:hypothetical protein [bacterium]